MKQTAVDVNRVIKDARVTNQEISLASLIHPLEGEAHVIIQIVRPLNIYLRKHLTAAHCS